MYLFKKLHFIFCELFVQVHWSWLCDDTGQGWDECPWDVVSPSSLEAFKGQSRQILDEGSFKETQIVGVRLA